MTYVFEEQSVFHQRSSALCDPGYFVLDNANRNISTFHTPQHFGDMADFWLLGRAHNNDIGLGDSDRVVATANIFSKVLVSDIADKQEVGVVSLYLFDT